MIYYILSLLYSLAALSLDPHDIINGVEILEVRDQNIVLINKGISDGITKGDHIRLRAKDKSYLARGICLKTGVEKSFWKIYRIPDPSLISKDYSYIIESANLSQITPDKEIIRDISFNESIIEKKPYQFKRDLPEKLENVAPYIKMKSNDDLTLLDKNLQKLQLRQDFRKINFAVFGSPLTRQTMNKAETYRYGFQGGNLAQKYKLDFKFEQNQSRMVDPYTSEGSHFRQTNAESSFKISNFSGWMNSLTYFSYRDISFSSVGAPKHHWQFGPIGMEWRLYRKDDHNFLDFAYIPLYDLRNNEARMGDKITAESNDGLRHGFRLNLKRNLGTSISMANELWVKPFQKIATWETDFSDLNLRNDFVLTHQAYKNIFLDYHFIYEFDKIWRTQSSLPSTNTINSLDIRFNFDL